MYKTITYPVLCKHHNLFDCFVRGRLSLKLPLAIGQVNIVDYIWRQLLTLLLRLIGWVVCDSSTNDSMIDKIVVI